jgi:large subunit ribosomal protein L9
VKVKILLKDTVEGLGMIGDIVDVAPGYARNYILPKKLGLEVNAGTMQAIDAAQKKRAELEAQRKLTLEELAGKLSACEITIAEKVSKTGSLYGSVSASSVVAALLEKGLEVTENMVNMPEQHIKSVGEYTVTFHLHQEIEDPGCKLTVEASGEVSDEDSEEDSDASNAEVEESAEPVSEIEED